MKIDTVEVELKAKDVDKIKENIFLKEIVRCKDCKFNKAKDKDKGVCGLMVYVHNADDYCSYGERKEQEHE